MTEGAALDFKMWERAGRLIFQAASIGDEAASGVIKPWRLIMDLLRQLQSKRNAKVVEGVPWTPSKTGEGNWAPGELVGGLATAPGVQGSKVAMQDQATTPAGTPRPWSALRLHSIEL